MSQDADDSMESTIFKVIPPCYYGVENQDTEDSVESAVFKVVPSSFNNSAHASFESIRMNDYGGNNYRFDVPHKLELSSPGAPRRNGRVDEVLHNVNSAKNQFVDFETSSPSRFLQNYADGSIGLIHMFPMYSSAPNSRDSTKDVLASFAKEDVTTRVQNDSHSKIKGGSKENEQSKIYSSNYKPKSTLSSDAEFATFSSQSTLSSAAVEFPALAQEIAGSYLYDMATNPENLVGGQIKIKKKAGRPRKVVKATKKAGRKARSVPPKTSFVLNRRSSSADVKENFSQSQKVSGDISIDHVLSFSANRPRRNINRPSSYFDRQIEKEEEEEEEEEEEGEEHSSSRSSTSSHTSLSMLKRKSTKTPKMSKSLASNSGSGRASTVRSKSGCWTCRLRRKKCPEEKPDCSECQRLGLSCDNSDSSRPLYMNDKKAAKKKMDEIKEITNLKKKLRMTNRSIRYRVLQGPST